MIPLQHVLTLRAKGAFLAAIMAAETSVSQPPDLPDTPDFGERQIFYTDARGQARTLNLHVIHVGEIKDHIRSSYGYSADRPIDLKQYPRAVEAYITEMLGTVAGLRSSEERAGLRDHIVNQISHDNPIKNAAIVHRGAEYRQKSAIITLPDLDAPDHQWIAGLLKINPQNLKADTGLNTDLLKDWIADHEIGHGLLSPADNSEVRADRYATLRALQKYGLTDRTVRTLRFIADTRLGVSLSENYIGCHDETRARITPEAIRAYAAALNDNEGVTPRNYDPILTLNDPVLTNRNALRPFYLATVIWLKEADSQGHFLQLARDRATEGNVKHPNDPHYKWTIEAAERLQTLLNSDPRPSVYASMNPVSDALGWHAPIKPAKPSGNFRISYTNFADLPDTAAPSP